jgi:LDH2 family malate/lactate/ureidoglycolate dehydrogenase
MEVLTNAGVPGEYAGIVADSLVLADLRGVDTHGINRLPGYIARVRAGVLDPSPNLEFSRKSPVMASLDAKNTFGFVAGRFAIDHAISMAETFGVGIVGVKNSGHYGMAATYLLRAIERGYAAFAFTNASRSMPAWGSKEPLLGTNPFAIGFPGGQRGHFVLDMSPSVVARVSLQDRT